MKLTWAIALLLVMGAFQNCADTGFGSNGMGEAALNSKGKDDGKKTSPVVSQNPSGEFAINKIWNKFVCKSSADLACPALYSETKSIGRGLTLTLNPNGSYVLRAQCFREYGTATFKSSGGNLYVSFKASDVTPMIGEVPCGMPTDIAFEEAIQLFHNSNRWLAKNIEGEGNSTALTDGQNHYLLLNQLKKPGPVVNDSFYVNGVEQEQLQDCPIPTPVPGVKGGGQATTPAIKKCSGWVSYTPMHEKILFTLSSDGKFKLEANCLIMTGSMPLVGTSPSGFAIKVIVNRYEATCANAAQRMATDPTVIAFEVLKGGIDYSISATGDAFHRIRDAKQRSLYMSKQYVPIYVTVSSGVSAGNPGSGI